MKSVFISDLDHTLLHSNATLSEYTRQSWNAKAQEHHLSIATARSFYSASKLLETFTINAPMILLDGALILSEQHDIIDAKFLDEAKANALIGQVREFMDLQPFVVGLIGEELKESFDIPIKRNGVQERILKNYQFDTRILEHTRIVARPATLKLVYMGTKTQMLSLIAFLNQHFEDIFELKVSPESYSGGYFLTILHPQGDKAHGLRTLSQNLNIDLKHFTVFGDSMNDIGMFKLSGTSVAVANALDEVKQHANIILNRSNDEDAVAHFLNQSPL